MTDCAVCAEGYAPTVSYDCRECSDADKPSALGLVVAMFVVLAIGAVVLLAQLVRAIDSGCVEETDIARGSVERRCIHWKTVLTKVFPLTAVKIVVVVWQIISQVFVQAGLSFLRFRSSYWGSAGYWLRVRRRWHATSHGLDESVDCATVFSESRALKGGKDYVICY